MTVVRRGRGRYRPAPLLWVAAPLAALMALAFGLRIFGLSAWSPSGDDVFHIRSGIGASLSAVVQASLQHDGHPPLLHVLTYLLHRSGMYSLGTMRLLAIVPGVLLVPIFYAVGYEATASRAAGFFAATLATLSAPLVLLSQMVRQYSLLMFFLGLAMWSCLRWSRRRHHRYLVLYFLTATLAITTNYSAVFIVGALGVAGLLHAFRHPKRGRATAIWSVGHLLMAALFAVQIASLYGRATRSSYMKETVLTSFYEVPSRLASIEHGLFFASERWRVPFVFGAFALAGAAIVLRARRFDLALATLVPILLNIVTARLGLYPLSNVRHVVFLVLPATVLAACTFARVFQRLGILGRVVFVAAVGIVFLFNPIAGTPSVFRPDTLRYAAGPQMPYSRIDAQRAFDWLTASAQPNDVVIKDSTMHASVALATLLAGRQGWDAVPRPRGPTRMCPHYLFRLDGLVPIDRCLTTAAVGAGSVTTGRLWMLVGVGGLPLERFRTQATRCLPPHHFEVFGDVGLLGFELPLGPKSLPRCW